MKFVCLAGTEVENESLKCEYKAAERLGEVRLGESHLFYRYFIKIKYISYGEITRAYLREESGESGEFLLKEYYLMLETVGGICYKLRMEREGYAREVLDNLEKEYEQIKIGFNRPSRSK